MTVLIVETTVARDEDAEMLAQTLLAEGLVACAQQSRILSRYRWAGAWCCESELRLSFKTCPQYWSQLVARIRALHPYDCPQILAYEAQANADYEDFVRTATVVHGDEG